MGDSDGDGGSFGSVETVTDSEQEANAAALRLEEKAKERRKKKQLESVFSPASSQLLTVDLLSAPVQLSFTHRGTVEFAGESCRRIRFGMCFV